MEVILDDDADQSVMTFYVGGLCFGFATHTIRNILEDEPATRVPLTPAHVSGIINNHGVMIPVVDLRLLMGLTPDPELKEVSIVVGAYFINGVEEQIGFRVDEIDDVIESKRSLLNKECVLDLPKQMAHAYVGHLKYEDRFLHIMRITKLVEALMQ